jgi:CBS-domain-containing membrane protein
MKTLRGILGIETAPVRHLERLLSTLGGFAGILAIFLISSHFLGPQSVALIVASMGASAVLLFAVPHGPLSQPWPVFTGHLVSAVIGVTCAIWIPDLFFAAAAAVGLAIGAMHYLRAIHPPGGATALTAVAGGADIHALGYQFVLTPVLLNVLVILVIAVIFNAPFPWRRYPAYFRKNKAASMQARDHISHADLVYALSELNTFIDITEQDLLRIYNLATKRSIEAEHLHISQIHHWHYYSDGVSGEDWTIRQLVDEDDDGKNIIYKTIVGPGIRSTGHVTRKEFAAWAAYEVELVDGKWQRVFH